MRMIVSLVNMGRTHEKISVHAMAVKYGGKFIDSFLKVFEFLQAHFPARNELILLLVRELQKATRTLQALCSEAKLDAFVGVNNDEEINSIKKMPERLISYKTSPHSPWFKLSKKDELRFF